MLETLSATGATRRPYARHSSRHRPTSGAMARRGAPSTFTVENVLDQRPLRVRQATRVALLRRLSSMDVRIAIAHLRRQRRLGLHASARLDALDARFAQTLRDRCLVRLQPPFRVAAPLAVRATRSWDCLSSIAPEPHAVLTRFSGGRPVRNIDGHPLCITKDPHFTLFCKYPLINVFQSTPGFSAGRNPRLSNHRPPKRILRVLRETCPVGVIASW